MWPFSRTCQSKARLVGKTVIITGANTGIGKETARDLYRRGARVILACRDLVKANAAAEELKKTTPSKPDRAQFQGESGELVVCKLDLSNLASVRECAKNLLATESSIHILINNAGVMVCPYEKTEDGFEMQFQSNHLGHFLFTLFLLPKLIASAPGCRIINVSSMAHQSGVINFDDINSEKAYSRIGAYAQSKLANILFTKELARRLKDAQIEGITVYSLHPGVVSTEVGRHLDTMLFRGARAFFNTLFVPFIKNAELGAQTTIYCAVDEEAGKESGLYYKECGVTNPSARAKDEQVAVKLWNESIKYVGLEPQDNLADLLNTISQEVSASKL